MTAHGEREVDLDTVTQFVPGGVEKAFLSHLQPNFNYSCVVETELRQKTLPLLFSTQYAGPLSVDSKKVYGGSNTILFFQLQSPQKNQ